MSTVPQHSPAEPPDHRIARAGTLGKGFQAGVGALFEGMGLLWREKSLWPLAAAPVLFAAVAVAAASYVVFHFAGTIDSTIGVWLPQLQAEAWYSWLWIGPGKVLLWVVRQLLFLIVAAFCLLAAFLGANLLAAPLLERLSQRVEVLITGECREPSGGALGALGNELRRLMFFAAGSVVFALFGVVPVLQFAAPFAFALFTMLFLPLEYCGAALDRREVPFRERRRWIARNGLSMLGFGGTAFVTILVPGLNFLMIPALVVAGTLLVVRGGPVKGE